MDRGSTKSSIGQVMQKERRKERKREEDGKKWLEKKIKDVYKILQTETQK